MHVTAVFQMMANQVYRNGINHDTLNAMRVFHLLNPIITKLN